MSQLLKIEFTLPESEIDSCSVFLGEKAAHGWEEIPLDDDSIHYTIHLKDHPLAMNIVDEINKRWPYSGCKFGEIEEENWGLAWKDFFVPLMCGEVFEILPPWMTDQKHEHMTHIIIEPKMAFGTGSHPTTSLCLELIGELKNKGRIKKSMNFMDLGTGSGILAIAMAKIGMKGSGVDIDPQAVVCARENIKANNVEDNITLAVGSAEAISTDAKYDIFVANILSGPLMELSTDIVPHLKDNGILILSGLLQEQSEKVAEAYMNLGLPEPQQFVEGEWAALLWS
jgi:ribosomal protein L11 methyltransferase